MTASPKADTDLDLLQPDPVSASDS